MPLCLIAALAALSQTSAIDARKAALYFDEYRAATELEKGRTWGRALGAPVLFIDPVTRMAVTNQADSQTELKEQDGVFVGTLPPNKLIGNALVEWGKTQWVMILWPVPESYTERMTLLIHESFHRIQPELGFIRQGDPCSHLNTREGRYWMQLEWRALARALRETGNPQKEALKDAMLFRRRRYHLFPGAQVSEARLERLEGTPSYTGTKLRGTADAESWLFVAKRLEDAVSTTENLPRMFAYLTGPAHGFLLDRSGTPWKENAATIQDFGEAVATALEVYVRGDLRKGADAAAARYGGKALLAMENERELKIKEKIAAFEKLLVKGPVLELPMGKWSASTNALKMTPIGDRRTVHTYIVANSDWGRLEVSNSAALVDETIRIAYVPMPFASTGTTLLGNGWKITLNFEWKAVEGARRGDMKIVRTEPAARSD